MLRAVIVTGGLAHAAAAGLWWWLAPGGFPLGHSRWIAGALLPAALVLLGLVALARRWSHAALASWTAMWCLGAVTALVLYDAGRFRIAMGCVVPCGTLLVVCLAASLVGRSRWDLRAALLAVVGAAIGVAFPFAVRGPAASTTPLGGTPPAADGEVVSEREIDVGHGVRVNQRSAVVWTEHDGVDVSVQPLLRFWSRSPDRGWTLFARPRLRGADNPLALTRAIDTESGVRLFARGSADHVLDVWSARPGAFRCQAWSDLEQPEYAHQTCCARVVVRGLETPRIQLSVAPKEILDVLPADYPSGRPARFAALYPDGVLRVLEASSGEKGPFSTLAEGPLDDDVLMLVLHDGDRERVLITLHGFAAQASTELSPTAGWGVPQNDISFVRKERPDEVHVLVTWAGTGIGRGFDTVGHATGTYRYRIDVDIWR